MRDTIVSCSECGEPTCAECQGPVCAYCVEAANVEAQCAADEADSARAQREQAYESER